MRAVVGRSTRRVVPALLRLDTARRRLGWAPPVLGALSLLASTQRRLRRGVTFVGVTGSGGKTTAVVLIAAVLGARDAPRRPHSGPLSRNTFPQVMRRMLAVRPGSRACVVEVAASQPASVARSAGVLRPDIAVVTNVGFDHLKAFGTPDAIAAEKQSLVAALAPGGTAVLNADDERVHAMNDACRGRVITFGLSPSADVRALDVRGAWPKRLTFTACHRGESVPVDTRLVGRHWVTSALAALAVGVARGGSLAEAARALAAVEPLPGRMSPVELEDGVTFIRDDWKAPLWSLPSALEFLQEAEAARKIVVIGTISDYRGAVGRKYRAVARQALAVADQVCFVGHNAHLVRRERKGPRGHALEVFETVKEAADALNPRLRPGDLVLLKGSNRADHLVRILLARTGGIACWQRSCGRQVSCDICRLRSVPSPA